MKVKFNKIERVAGLFLLFAIIGVLVTAVSVAVKQGWFATKIYYSSVFENADGIRPGTLVQMAGLHAGAVEDVELQTDNKIKINFYVLSKFEPRIRQDSTAQLIRPFIIGDRALEVSVGSESLPLVPPHHVLASNETLDIMSLLSGKALGVHLAKLSSTLENLAHMVEALTDKARTQSLVRIFDRLDPLLMSIEVMATEMTKLSRQVTYKGNLQTVVSNLSVTTHELNAILPDLNRENPELAKDIAQMSKNLASLTSDFKVLGPAIKSVGPELPQATRRAVEALNETVIMLKAAQKSMFMRGNVQEVREEEALQRKPAHKEESKP
ncbi:MAG TPA: MlaD family protein [Pseudobdellovibrionaceae bacterium]|jgi:phospholipid/cholesterol/gamma-HCH transport system substrate-binding protein